MQPQIFLFTYAIFVHLQKKISLKIYVRTYLTQNEKYKRIKIRRRGLNTMGYNWGGGGAADFNLYLLVNIYSLLLNFYKGEIFYLRGILCVNMFSNKK